MTEITIPKTGLVKTGVNGAADGGPHGGAKRIARERYLAAKRIAAGR
jgi:hypothetical protein